MESKTIFETNRPPNRRQQQPAETPASCAADPEMGPSIVFFSGGSALRGLSKELIGCTHNSIHIVTPFDSGGSSAALRKAFDMPAVGDIRNRLIALADRQGQWSPRIRALLALRLPKSKNQGERLELLRDIVAGSHPLVKAIPGTARQTITGLLSDFTRQMPPDFDLAGASIGNLVLAGAYLSGNRRMDGALAVFSELASVKGIVQPVSSLNLHLAAVLENGRVVVGQHRITGKENMPIESPVKDLFLCRDETDPSPVSVSMEPQVRRLIEKADLLVYPMGSFYSSLVCNLLVRGVGETVSRQPCSKVYVPNTTADPEAPGMDVADQAAVLLSSLKKDIPGGGPTENLLTGILVDRKNGSYPGGIDERRIRQMGIEIVDCPLVTKRSAPLIDEKRLTAALLSLTG